MTKIEITKNGMRESILLSDNLSYSEYEEAIRYLQNILEPASTISDVDPNQLIKEQLGPVIEESIDKDLKQGTKLCTWPPIHPRRPFLPPWPNPIYFYSQTNP